MSYWHPPSCIPGVKCSTPGRGRGAYGTALNPVTCMLNNTPQAALGCSPSMPPHHLGHPRLTKQLRQLLLKSAQPQGLPHLLWGAMS